MKTKTLITAAAAAFMAAAPAMAELFIPSLTYRSGPYAANGIPTADGYADYLTLLNERDGGIGGEPINMVECETGYNTEKGVECYEALKGQGALVFHPWSTGITYQLIPKATADGIPVHSVGYGRTSAKNGEVFRDQAHPGRRGWQPGRQEDRAGLPQLRLRQGTDPDPGRTGRDAWL